MLALLGLMTVCEGVLCYNAFRNMKDGSSSLEALISSSRISLVFAVCFVILSVFLCINSCDFTGGKNNYTFLRLSLSEKQILLCWFIVNLMCLFIFWALQLALAYIISLIYIASAGPTYINEQTIFLAFYRNDFLHSLLPLSEISRHVRNLLLILGMALSSASFPYKFRKGQYNYFVLPFVIMILLFFPMPPKNLAADLFICLFAEFFSLGSVIQLK